MENFIKGYKTYTGIAIAIAGTLGIGNLLGNENLAGIADSALQLIGFVFAAIGSYYAHKK